MTNLEKKLISGLTDLNETLKSGKALEDKYPVTVRNKNTGEVVSQSAPTTTDPIAAKAEALWAKRPELRPLGLKYALSPVSKEMEWWLDDYGITDDDAHMLIEAACWRALPWAYHREFVDIDGTLKTYVIERPQRFDEGKMIAQAPSLTEALIAACMEAKP